MFSGILYGNALNLYMNLRRINITNFVFSVHEHSISIYLFRFFYFFHYFFVVIRDGSCTHFAGFIPKYNLSLYLLLVWSFSDYQNKSSVFTLPKLYITFLLFFFFFLNLFHYLILCMCVHTQAHNNVFSFSHLYVKLTSGIFCLFLKIIYKRLPNM